MSKNFDKKLIKLLETGRRWTDQNGKLIKRAVIDRAWRTDPKLVRLLLSDPEVKAKFFDKIGGALVFNAKTLIDYISNKKFLGDSWTRFRNKIGLNIDGKFLRERGGEVSLVWPYKDCVLEGGQTKEEETRKEIFFNEILAHDEINRLFDPKVLTGWKRHTAKGAEAVSAIKRDKSGTIRENLIIKGNNLLALHTLKQQFQGKVKLIYIDPPYNTGGDHNIFTYNNTFNHSSWLVFMKNRLETAKKMLREDGFIATAIDHYELGYLIVLADEVFGRENRLAVISVVHKPEGRSQEKFFGTSNEFMLVYAKSKAVASFQKTIINERKKKEFNLRDEKGNYKLRSFIRGEAIRKEKPHLFYPIYASKDLKNISIEKRKGYEKILPVSGKTERAWFLIPESLKEKITKKEIVAKKTKEGTKIFYKVREHEVFVTHWTDKKYNAVAYGTKLLDKTIGGKSFSYPKSLYTVLDTLKIMTDKNDIVMDFFAGSGTTAHAALQLNKEDGGNRKFILVEQLEDHIKVCEKRTAKVLQSADIQNSGQTSAFEPDQLFLDQNSRKARQAGFEISRKEGVQSEQADSSINYDNDNKARSAGKTENQTNDGKENETSFIYCELMKYNEAFMDRIQAAKSSKELSALWKDIAENSFLNWYVNPEMPEDALNDFIKIGEEEDFVSGDHSLPPKSELQTEPASQNHSAEGGADKNTSVSQKSAAGQGESEEWKNQKYIEKTFGAALKEGKTGLERQKRLSAALLDKNQLYVCLSEIDDKDFKVSKEDKRLNKLFFNTDK